MKSSFNPATHREIRQTYRRDISLGADGCTVLNLLPRPLGEGWGEGIVAHLAALLIALGVCVSLAGCSFLKPAHSTGRHFVLTPLPAGGQAKVPADAFAVGLAQVKLPSYLFDTSLAVRKGTNEIEYLTSVLWAERLDTGIQNVLAANLRSLLPTDQVRLSTWRSAEVAVEVYAGIQQFDVDSSGQATLVASWRILSPGAEKTLKAGESRLTRKGPSPAASPSAAIATLSELVADLSRQLAQALKETTPAVTK